MSFPSAIGCRDFETPPNAWIKRGGDDDGGLGGTTGEVTVGCDGSDEVWQVVCDENKWEGTTGNCSAGLSPFLSLCQFVCLSV